MSKELKVRVFDRYSKAYLTSRGKEYGESPFVYYNLGVPYNLSEILAYKEEHGYDRFKVEEFTGLRDKDGIDIYDGDILQNELTKRTYEVCWDSGGEWVKCDLQDGRLDEELYKSLVKCTIIGNVSENE